jgi:hypothetical protein
MGTCSPKMGNNTGIHSHYRLQHYIGGSRQYRKEGKKKRRMYIHRIERRNAVALFSENVKYGVKKFKI